MRWDELLDQKLKEYLPDMTVRADEPMSSHTSFRIGGPARRMAFPKSSEQVVLLVHFSRECGTVPLMIGNGTNLLAADEGLDRLVVDMSGLNEITLDSSGQRLTAGAGAPLSRLADFAQKQGLTGLEFAHGIPGTVGGAVCMNAGAYGGEMKQVVSVVTVLDPKNGVRTLSGEEMRFAYRKSLMTEHPDWVVLRAEFALHTGDPATIRETMNDLIARRRASQPLEYPSAGSTFRRPEGYFAGTLIDQCGLKGRTVGGAQVSMKHAGFVINLGGATCADVVELIRQVQQTVWEKKGVQLEPEVKIITE